MLKNTQVRLFIGVVTFVFIFLFPWWMGLLLIITLNLFYDKYYEGILFGFILDRLSFNQGFLMSNIFIFTSFFILIIFHFFRSRVFSKI